MTCTTLGPTAYVMCREFRRPVRHGFGPATETWSSWSQQGRQAGRRAKFYDPGLMKHYSPVPTSEKIPEYTVAVQVRGRRAPSLLQWTAGGLVSAGSKLCHLPARQVFQVTTVALRHTQKSQHCSCVSPYEAISQE
jgi:hypothetical protein